MVLEKLPERVRTHAVARAMFSPSATLLAGIGVSAAVLAGAPVVAAAVVGAAAWLGRVAMAVPRTPREQRVDPGRVRDPWRSFVVDALDARRRFGLAAGRARPGPLQDRLRDLARRLDDAVGEVWRIARQGDALVSGLDVIDVAGAQAELDELRDAPASPSKERAEAALKSQLATHERLRRVAGDAVDRLRALNAQLDESVARAVELSLSAGDHDSLTGVADQVDSVVGEMEALRQALEEA
ncbi:MAG TPA: hypothetical protein VGO92_00535 [Acidimicrobiales bacterium]|jgi:hypothetical protein|nr:hypothetical protein [Acidimicrobiales bacterium]